MNGRTRDVLLWLAGTGGAIVVLREAWGLLESLGTFVPPILLGALLVFAMAGIAALAALRRRLGAQEEPLAFTETRP